MSMTNIVPKRRGRPILSSDLRQLSAQRRSGLKDLQDMLYHVPTVNMKLGRSIINAYKDGLIVSKTTAKTYLSNLSKKGAVIDRTQSIIDAMQKPVIDHKLKLYSVSGRVRLREYLPKKKVRGVAIEPYFYEYELGTRKDTDHFGIPIIHNMTREVEAISPQDAIEKYNSRIYDDIDVKDIIDDGYWVRYKVMNIEVDDIVDIHATKAYKVKREEEGELD